MRNWLKRIFGHPPEEARRKSIPAPAIDSAREASASRERADRELAVTQLRQLAAQRPDDVDVLYRLGDSLYQLDRIREALAPLERAARLGGNVAAHHYLLANVQKDLGQPIDALHHYSRALQLEPGHARALNNAGTILEEQGNTEDALQHYRRAIAADATLEPAHQNFAMLLHLLSRFSEAEAAYRVLLDMNPRAVTNWCNLGNVYIGLERVEDAAQCYNRALEHDPASALAYFRLGVAFLHQGMYPEAETAARRAVELAPGLVEGWINLGDTLQSWGRLDKALEIYQHGLTLAPNHPDILNNMGTAHRVRQSLEMARQFFERALAASPQYILGKMNLAGIHVAYGMIAEATAGYRDILEADPKHEQAARQLLLTLLYESSDADAFFAAHLAYAERFRSGTAPAPAWEPQRPPGAKLRIGYVSSDLRRHPVGYNMAPLIEHYDRSRFEVYLYTHLKRPDDYTRQFQTWAHASRSITYLSDRAAAQMMREDRLDILVLLAGRFDENRPLLATYRPAPIIVSMHDPATSGLKEVDYLIADRALVPRRTKEKFTERVVRLPTFYLHRPLHDVPLFPEPPVLSNGAITFGSFNNPAKINAGVVRLWAGVLRRIPGAALLLKYTEIFSIPGVRSRYLKLFEDHGIAADRLIIPEHGVESRERHLAHYAQIDIALDTFPFTGSTTTFEALWMGVPVVTLEGERMVARWSAAMLRKVGLPQLIARSEEEYIEIAAALAADTGALARLRSELRERVVRSPLCAEQARARQLERLYRRMWAIWLKQQAASGQQSAVS